MHVDSEIGGLEESLPISCSADIDSDIHYIN